MNMHVIKRSFDVKNARTPRMKHPPPRQNLQKQIFHIIHCFRLLFEEFSRISVFLQIFLLCDVDYIPIWAFLKATVSQKIRAMSGSCVIAKQTACDVCIIFSRVYYIVSLFKALLRYDHAEEMIAGATRSHDDAWREQMEEPNSFDTLVQNANALDSLTGAYHRRYLEQKLPEAMLSCQRQGQPLSVIYADIDRFSQINERCGRIAGDLVLQHVAQILRKRTARPESWVARYQADAFVICLPGVKSSVARRLATSLRLAVMGERLPLEGCEITTTCSFAVQSVACEEELPSAQALLRQAREQAALAKKSGGNMVL